MKYLFACSLLLTIWLSPLRAQVSPDSASIQSYAEEARQMVAYMAYTFNALGSSNTSPREKDILINQSYDKIFRDAEVQVEDDLIPGRSVVTNKDVQAYLKDIDFFFQSAEFEYLINDIEPHINEAGQWYFLVSAERRLRGLTVDGDSINNSQPRFLEIDIYPEERMLKIASLYTSRTSERADLVNWWNGMGSAWKQFFAPQVKVDEALTLADVMGDNGSFGLGDTILRDRSRMIYVSDSSIYRLMTTLVEDQPVVIGDSVRLEQYDTLVVDVGGILPQLRQLLAQRSLDLSGHQELQDLTPLSKMRQLRELDLSRTQVEDLTPLRNLAYLRRLDISHTQVFNLEPLRYNDALEELIADRSKLTRLDDLQALPQLKRLSVAQTLVGNLQPLRACPNLQELNLAETMVLDLSGIEALEHLRVLNVARTNVLDLAPLRGQHKLRVLNCEQTGVSDLQPLAQADNLHILRCDQTRVMSLQPLVSLAALKRVYCDQTLVNKAEVNRFRAQQPGVIVVFASATLQEWWKGLSNTWRDALWPQGKSQVPNREQLQRIAEIDSLDLQGEVRIQSLRPLQILDKLR